MPLLTQKRPSVKPEAVLRQIRLMESLDTTISEEATVTLSNWLLEGCGITQILKYYISCQSIRALELLCNHVREPHDKVLLDQISNCLEKNASGTIILLGRLINNGPSWLSKLPSHEIFARILDLIKSGKNLEHVNSALFLLASLLPYCPPSEQIVKDLFRSFLDACKLYHQKNKSSMEKLKQAIDSSTINPRGQLDNPFVMTNIICLVQIGALQNSLKIFFGSLYGLYPNTVLTLLQKCVQTTGSVEFFSNVLEPILISCRTHPNILLENRDRELNLEKWKERQPDELFAMCEKVTIPEANAQIPCFTFKQQLSNNLYGNQADLNALDANTLAHFKKGCQSFALSSRVPNRFGLETPPNEADEFTDHSEIDFFDNLNLEKLLNNSLTMNSNSSSKNRLSPYGFAKEASESQQTSIASDQESRQSKTKSVDQPAFKPTKILLKRSSSDTNLSRAQKSPQTNKVQLPWSVAKMLCNTINRSSFENSFELVKKKTEYLRDEYMQEGENYHQQLKLLGLADRLPGKIYDDLHSIMKGLNVENQKDLLESRLRLVNHHLMFERSCRLMLSKRSRHLFERLKSHNTDNMELVDENKQLHSQFEQINHRLQEMHNEKVKLQAKLQEKDQFYLSKLQTANAAIDDLSLELNNLKHQFSTVEQNAQTHQRRLESLLLDEEHRLVEEQLADAQQEELQRLRYELTLSHQQNQELRDRCESLMLVQNKPAVTDQLHITSKRTSDVQLNNLKSQLQKSRNTVEEWTQRYKQLEQNYTNQFEQRAELEASVVRAAKIYALQTKSTNQKYDSLMTICTKQEAHIAYLYGLLKKSTAKNSTARKIHSSFKEIFPFEEMNCEEIENRNVDDHLFELFGQEDTEKLELIDRSNDVSSKKVSNYVPSSSLDTFVPVEVRHERRFSLTTLPISVEFGANQDEYKEEETHELDGNSSSKASSSKSTKISSQTPDLPHYFPF